jgi:hypothetical protein
MNSVLAMTCMPSGRFLWKYQAFYRGLKCTAGITIKKMPKNGASKKTKPTDLKLMGCVVI